MSRQHPSSAKTDFIVILILSTIVLIAAIHIDFFETLVQFTRDHEEYELDEIFTLPMVLAVGLAFFSFRRWQSLKVEMALRLEAEKEREEVITELQTALDQVKTLRGMLPICANCKKIRDDKGYWQQVDLYITTHSEAVFSHSICPDCIRKLYPDLADDVLKAVEKKKKP